jgi:hypothetical protein
MADAGATIRPGSLTEQNHFTEAIAYIQNWFDGLDEPAREGLDAVTTDEEHSSLLVGAGIAPYLDDLMADFDAMRGWPLSTLLQWCSHCATQAAQGVAQQ